MSQTAKALGDNGILFECKAIGDDETVGAEVDRRKAHRELLRLYHQLDPMDALHIVVGTEIGAKSFVSFDEGWDAVATINVCR